VSAEAANKLESWYAGLPGIVQSTLHEPYQVMDNALRSVSGDPDALRAAAPHYLQYAQQVHQLAAAQLQDTAALNGHWEGEAHEAFSQSVTFVDQQLQQLEAALKGVPELLESGAQACVEGANMIIDIVTSLVMFAIGILVTNLALSVLTFGASLAAAVVEVLAEAAAGLARVASVVEKVAAVLEKIANVLEKIAKILAKIRDLLQKLSKALDEEKAALKTYKGMDRIKKQATFIGKNVAVSQAIKYGTGGYDSPPGGVGKLYEGGKDYYGAWQDTDDAQDAANAH
jgi:WXG100 family type VII secretion target